MTLKKLPCVSFAGVDSLDDVKNHTYNELFVSGGFIVSDESILNPEVVTIGKNEYVIFSVFFLGCGCPRFSGKIKTKGLKNALLLCHSQLTGLFLSFPEFLPPQSSSPFILLCKSGLHCLLWHLDYSSGGAVIGYLFCL